MIIICIILALLSFFCIRNNNKTIINETIVNETDKLNVEYDDSLSQYLIYDSDGELILKTKDRSLIYQIENEENFDINSLPIDIIDTDEKAEDIIQP